MSSGGGGFCQWVSCIWLFVVCGVYLCTWLCLNSWLCSGSSRK